MMLTSNRLTSMMLREVCGFRQARATQLQLPKCEPHGPQRKRTSTSRSRGGPPWASGEENRAVEQLKLATRLVRDFAWAAPREAKPAHASLLLTHLLIIGISISNQYRCDTMCQIKSTRWPLRRGNKSRCPGPPATCCLGGRTVVLKLWHQCQGGSAGGPWSILARWPRP